MGRASNIEQYTETSRSQTCAASVIALRKRLGLSRELLGKALKCSAATVSRMESGAKLTAHLCVQLGNLAGDPGCWFFWEQAGLRSTDVLRIIPNLQSRGFDQTDDIVLRLVHAGPHARVKESDLVAIPVLPLVLGTHGEKGQNRASWTGLVPTSVIAAPRTWCPSPAQTICFRVKGRSMMPTIPDGCVVVVDASQTDASKLHGDIVVAHNKHHGLVVSRLKNIDHVDVLVPEDQVGWSNVNVRPGWTLRGKVLWWIVSEQKSIKKTIAPDVHRGSVRSS